ncbi:MAG TPA: hypothetical protein VD993_13640 [Chitinophagaceae bacterium]|nr:hypothetical protein [Chitinophagaceae bacterium]
MRGVNSPEKDAAKRRFVFSSILESDQELARILESAEEDEMPIDLLLFVQLPQLKNHPEREAMMLRYVKQFMESGQLKLNAGDFEKRFPTDLYDVYLWHRDNNSNRNITEKDFLAEVEKSLGTDVKAFITQGTFYIDKLALWENLIAEYIMPRPENASFLGSLVDMVRWYWILEKLYASKLDPAQAFADGQEIYEAMHATVVLPEDVVHFELKMESEEPQTRPPADNPNKEKEKKRAKRLEDAANDLSYVFRNQQTDEKYRSRHREKGHGLNENDMHAKSPSAILSESYAGKLQKSTVEILEEKSLLSKNGIVVEHALEQLENERQAVAEKHREPYKTPGFVNIKGQRYPFDNPCQEYSIPDPCAPYNQAGIQLPQRVGLVRTPGMADLKVIKSVLLKYERGELAHVENVLKGETKTREFNTLKRTEDTLVTEEESTTETEKETQSTDRFELEKEMSSITKEDMKIDSGVKVTATLGPVSIDTHFNFQYNTSKEESNRTATKNAQEVMNRALARLIEKKRTQRTVTTIIQTEDKNKHELNNEKGADHVRGLYYWIDKYYLSKVVNYGKRMMFEFVVPEPAAFYLHTKRKQSEGEKAAPVHPFALGVISFNTITESNYAALAAFYNAPDVSPPPPAITIVTTSLKQDKLAAGKDVDDEDSKKDIEFTVVDADERLKIPAGYIAHHADISFVIKETKAMEEQCDDGWWGTGINKQCKDEATGPQNFHILIGNKHLRPASGNSPITNLALNTEDKVIPVAIAGLGRHFIANVEIICYRTDRHYKEWQNQTFGSVLAAYNKLRVEYEDWQKSTSINEGIVIEGNNPGINRKIEKEELKKHCITMMTGQRFESFDAMRSNAGTLGYPEFSILESYIEGNYIQFFEQAFEWEQITYVFYPYFWGRKPNWLNIKNLGDPDPIFNSFLQAGAARVLLPARPGFEYDVTAFFASGGRKIWGGKQAPIPGSNHWLSLIDELKEQEGQFKGGVQEGDPWIYKLPTTLVYLDNINAALLDNTVKYPKDYADAMKPKPGDFS